MPRFRSKSIGCPEDPQIIVYGEKGVGKTSFVYMYLKKGTFLAKYGPAVRDVYNKIPIVVDKTNICVTIVDCGDNYMDNADYIAKRTIERNSIFIVMFSGAEYGVKYRDVEFNEEGGVWFAAILANGYIDELLSLLPDKLIENRVIFIDTDADEFEIFVANYKRNFMPLFRWPKFKKCNGGIQIGSYELVQKIFACAANMAMDLPKGKKSGIKNIFKRRPTI